MTSKTPELLPCPWCGGSAAYQADAEIGFTTIHDMGTVKCNECGRSDGFVYRTKDAAIMSWNTRTPTSHADYDEAAKEVGLL